MKRDSLGKPEEERGSNSNKNKLASLLIPPPNPLLPRALMQEEPLRNGFFRKFM